MDEPLTYDYDPTLDEEREPWRSLLALPPGTRLPVLDRETGELIGHLVLGERIDDHTSDITFQITTPEEIPMTVARPAERFPALRERLHTAVFEALGAASSCWGNLGGAGVFESTRAKEIGDRLVAEIEDVTAFGKPSLGCATTQELIDELHARAEVARTIGEPLPLDVAPVDR